MRFQCPFCRGIVAVDNSQMGEEVQCGHCDEIVTVPTSRLATGSVIADFIIMEELGRGGMGVVYLAHQISLDRPAAVKILQESYANNAEFVVNFIKEARSAAKLNHPHIVQAYAVGEDEGIFYFAMEYIDGETMKAVLRREKILTTEKAVTIIQQIAEALDCAWKEQKLVHRDIKPDNIMLTKNGRAKLADLGLSRVAGDVEDEDEDEVMGTPQYISPEHLTGAPMDVRSDIYSLGATFYQFVTGRFPYEGNSATEIAKKHIEANLVPPIIVNPKVPEAVSQIIVKMMKKDVAERYQDAEELVEDLRMFRRGKLPTTLSMPKVFSTRTRAVSKSAVLSLPGTGPQSGAEVPTTTTGSLKPLFTSTTTTSSGMVFSGRMDDEIHGAPRKKVLLWTVLTITGIVVIAGAVIWIYVIPILKSPDSKKIVTPPPVVVKNTAPVPPPVKVNNDAEYCGKIDEMLLAYTKNPEDKAGFLDKADSFIEKYPQPDTVVKKEKLKDFLRVYVPLDEKARVLPGRQKLREAHLAEIDLRKKADERLQAEKRLQEEQRRKLEQAEKERKRKLDEEKRAQEQRVAEYLKSIGNKLNGMTGVFVKCCGTADAAVAEKTFTEAIAEPSRASGRTQKEKDAAGKLADYSKKLLEALNIGRQMDNLLKNSGTELEGLQIEYKRGSLGQIKKIENGVLTIKMMLSDETEDVKLSDLREFYLTKLINRVEKKNSIVNGFFFYMLYNGEYDGDLEKAAPDAFWKAELPKFERAYFKEKLKGATEEQKKELQTRFGTLESFKKALSEKG
ncbi:MAG: protein kinase [Victivallaceae bacterium]